ncbi:hypothetical protein [Emticicia fontis]
MERFLASVYKLFITRSLLSDLRSQTLLTPITISVLVLTAALCYLFYYNPVTKWRDIYWEKKHWVRVLFMASGLSFLISVVTCLQLAGTPRDPKDPESYILFKQGILTFANYGLVMAIFSAIFYILFSYLIRGKSINSSSVGLFS